MRSERPTRVLVLMGGPDAEREVSLMSGAGVAAALRENGRFEVVEQVIDRPTADEIRSFGGDVVFPVLHGQWGEGGPLQELLEEVGLPYVGCGPAAARLAMDKMRTKTILSRDGVDTPVAIEIAADDPCRLEPPIVIKPVDDGSSVDIRICVTESSIAEARRELHPRRRRLMAEAFVPGREVTVGIVTGTILPFIEIKPSVEFYDYEAKYLRDDTTYVLEPDLPATTARRCADASQLAWDRLGCRDIARVDFRIDADGRAWFLEINTMPGFTTHSLVPMAAARAGIPMPALCGMLVESAMERAIAQSSSAASV